MYGVILRMDSDFFPPNCIIYLVFVMNAHNLVKVEADYLCSFVYMSVHLQNVCVTVLSYITENLSFEMSFKLFNCTSWYSVKSNGAPNLFQRP